MRGSPRRNVNHSRVPTVLRRLIIVYLLLGCRPHYYTEASCWGRGPILRRLHLAWRRRGYRMGLWPLVMPGLLAPLASLPTTLLLLVKMNHPIPLGGGPDVMARRHVRGFGSGVSIPTGRVAYLTSSTRFPRTFGPIFHLRVVGPLLPIRPPPLQSVPRSIGNTGLDLTSCGSIFIAIDGTLWGPPLSLPKLIQALLESP